MLSVEGLRLRRGGRYVLDRIDLQLEAGEIRLLVGASGSGKTSLLRAVAGLEPPTEGRIRVNGQTASSRGTILVPPHRRGVAMAFQDGALWEHLTVEQHLRFGLSSRVPDAGRRDEIVEEALALVALESRADERPGHMSGGERQRLGLARALAQQPRLLLLDEPLAHIDLAGQRLLARDLTEHLQVRKTTTLWVTHRPREVAFARGALSLLENGRISRQISAEEVGAWLEEIGS